MVDIRLLQEQSDKMNDMVGIINPTSHDFICQHDSNADGSPVTYTIKSKQGLKLKRYIADHVSQKLCTQILSEYRGVVTQKMLDYTLSTIRLY